MYATEFETVVDNEYIKIPEFEAFKGHEVRVIVLNIDNEKNIEKDEKMDFIGSITKSPKSVSSQVEFLSRDASNER